MNSEDLTLTPEENASLRAAITLYKLDPKEAIKLMKEHVKCSGSTSASKTGGYSSILCADAIKQTIAMSLLNAMREETRDLK